MQEKISTAAQFGIVVHQSFYVIKGVKLPSGAFGDVDVTENLLDDGNYHTQKEWTNHRKKTGWGPCSAPLIFSVLSALYDNKGVKGVEKLRKLFADDFRNYLMMTATGISYRSSGLDIVTHDAGTPEERTLEARLVGSDGYVDAEMGDVKHPPLSNQDFYTNQ